MLPVFKNIGLSLLTLCVLTGTALSNDFTMFVGEGKILYLEREDDAKAADALEKFEEALKIASTDDEKYEAQIWLARTYYYRGTAAPDKKDKKKLHLAGRDHADAATKLNRKGADGWWFYGINLGKWAEANGIRKSISEKTNITNAMKRLLRIDETHDSYGPHRTLGRLFFKLPGILGGDKKKAYTHLKLAYDNAPSNSKNAVFYGEILISRGEKAEARNVLEALLAVQAITFYNDKNPELDRVGETKMDQEAARKLMKKLK